MKCNMCGYDPSLDVPRQWAFRLDTPAVSQNQLKGNGKGRSGWLYRKIRDKFLAMLTRHTLAIPKATQKRRVFFTRTYTGRAKPFDRDNLIAGMKPLRDCLTELGIIVDDSDKWLEAHYQQELGHTNTIGICVQDVTW